jgi:hypothetical protein
MQNYNQESHFTSGGNDLDLVSTLVGHLSTQVLWDWFSMSVLDSHHRNSISSLIRPLIPFQLKAGFLTSEKTSRATKLKERANKAKQTETVTPPTAQQVQDISFLPEGDTVPIQKATETQGDSLSGIPQDESLPGAQSRMSEKISHESDTQTQEQAQSQSYQQQGPLRRSR